MTPRYALQFGLQVAFQAMSSFAKGNPFLFFLGPLETPCFLFFCLSPAKVGSQGHYFAAFLFTSNHHQAALRLPPRVLAVVEKVGCRLFGPRRDACTCRPTSTFNALNAWLALRPGRTLQVVPHVAV